MIRFSHFAQTSSKSYIFFILIHANILYFFETLLFERFYRVEISHSGETGGTGLVLAIAKSIIDIYQEQK